MTELAYPGQSGSDAAAARGGSLLTDLSNAGRTVRSFVSASDPDRGLVVETCMFEPLAEDGASQAN